MKNWLKKLDEVLLRRHKLSTVLMILIGMWLMGAVVLVGLSLNTSWHLEDRGIAINEAGSLRKRVFHIMLLVKLEPDSKALLNEHQEFNRILNNLKALPGNSLTTKANYKILQEEIESIQKEFNTFWQETLSYRNSNTESLSGYLKRSEALTSRINKMVEIIEHDNTASIRFLNLLQGMFILMAIFSAVVSIRLLKYFVISPLLQLNDGIEKISEGDLNTHIVANMNNEFGQVTRGFNQMASRLNHMYDELEEMVFNKTVALRKRNYELAFLNEVSIIFQDHHEVNLLAQVFLEKILSFSDAKAGAVRMVNKNKNKLEIISSSGLPEEVLYSSWCNRIDACYCGQTSPETQTISFDLSQDVQDESILCFRNQLERLTTFPILIGDEKIGMINLFFDGNNNVDAEKAALIETVSLQFGMVIEGLRLNQLDKQMAVLEERNLMAQGLHDSIAQSLSFLNMQVQILEQSLSKQNEQKIRQSMDFIQEGVQGCYEDVRELLSNFRVRLTRGSFSDSVKSVIDRFERQANVKVSLQIHDNSSELEPEEQLQAVFILQEALSNIRKHAKASRVDVYIVHVYKNFKMVISDDGVGFDMQELLEKEEQGHVGTVIMKERASKVDGLLTIYSMPDEGTEIQFIITKKSESKEVNE